MNKFPFLFLLICFIQFKVYSTHIVGGEFELKHLEDFNYELTLITYFDDINGNPGILQSERSVTPYIFRKSDRALMTTVLLRRTEHENFVPYTNIDCIIGTIRTRRIVFKEVITLDPQLYDDPEGYMIVWERCCRNESITNIRYPDTSGNRFVLEIPPVVKDGEPFINSSPSLFPPLSDYACINQLYYVDFAGKDSDRDSLTYKLVTPRDASRGDPLLGGVPVPTADFNKDIEWISGISLLNVIPGNPSLNISNEGFITVRPFNPGLYVFSVEVEEFREGEKIGSLRRDFQMFVVDGCEPPAPPNASVRLPGESEFYNEVDTIRFTVSEEKCFDFLVTDDVGEDVLIRAQSVNFNEDLDQIFDFTQGSINSENDTLRVQVCVPECPYVRDIPYIIDLIASDNACPLPQLDTVRLIIEVQPPKNAYPLFSDIRKEKTLVLQEGDIYKDILTASDPDDDNLRVRLEGIDFEPADYGMSLNTTSAIPGFIEMEFVWDTNCQLYDFVQKNHFDAYVIVDDLDFCSDFEGDTIFYNLNVVLPLNTGPKVSTSLESNYIEAFLDETVSFDVNVEDLDEDEINLEMRAVGFESESVGVNFQESVGNGNVNSRFEWSLNCESLAITEDSSFLFYFFSEDEDDCREVNSDTLKLTIGVKVPTNNKPNFDLYFDFELTVNEPFSLDIIAEDVDNDFVNIDILSGTELPPSPSFSFERKQGQGRVNSTLEWTPECSLLGRNYSPENYTVFFLTWDESCPEVKYDTMAINFMVKELDVTYGEFLPPNVFTPNGDDHNDVYTLSGLIDNNANLPPDNCEDQFQSIFIFDRSGRQVFKSNDRDFVWRGDGLPTGVYYYGIKFLHRDYEGTITILY